MRTNMATNTSAAHSTTTLGHELVEISGTVQPQQPQNGGVSHQSAPNGTATKPKDVRHEFLRCEFNKRAAFRNEHNPSDNAKVDQELKYLACIQDDLKRDKKREDTVAKLHECYRSWKEEAKVHIELSLSQLHNSPYQDPVLREKYHSLVKRLNESWPEPSSPPITPSTAQGGDKDEEDYFNMNTYAMYFKKDETVPADGGSRDGETPSEPQTWTGHDSDDKRFSGKFPNQKIPAKTLLDYGQDSPLQQRSGSKCIRYFHIPTNNMKWVEVSLLLVSRLDAVANQGPNTRKVYRGTMERRISCIVIKKHGRG